MNTTTTTTIVFKQIINNIVIRKKIFDHVKRIHHQLKKKDSQSYKWVDIYSSFNLLVRFGYLNELKYRLENEGIDSDLYKLYNNKDNENRIDENEQIIKKVKEKKNLNHQKEEIDHRIIGLSKIACRYGHLKIIEYFNQHHQSRYIFNRDDITEAIRYEHKEIAEYLFDNRSEGYGRESITLAASKGYHQLLDRMLVKWNLVACPIQQFEIVGSLDALRIIHKYNQDILKNVTAEASIRRCDLEMVKFINEYYPDKIQKDTFRILSSDHRDICDYLLKNRKDVKGDYSCLVYAAWNGQLELLKELALEYPEQLYRLMNSQHIPVLEYLHKDHEVEFTGGAAEEAARIGNLDMIKYYHENNIKFDQSYVFTKAIHFGHHDIVKYIHYNFPGTSASWGSINWAVSKGHLEVIQFLHFYRTEDFSTAMINAINGNQLEVVKFLHQHRTEGYVPMDVTKVSLEVLEFIHLNRTEQLNSKVLKQAIKDSNIDVIKYIDINLPYIKFDPPQRLIPTSWEVLDYLSTNRKDVIIDITSQSNSYQTIKYLVDNKKVGDIPSIIFFKENMDIDRTHLICRLLNQKNAKVSEYQWSNIRSLEALKYLRLFRNDTLSPDNLFDNACEDGNLALIDYLLSKYSIRISSKHLGITKGHISIVKYLFDRWKATPKKLEEAINTSKGHSNSFVYDYLLSKQSSTKST